MNEIEKIRMWNSLKEHLNKIHDYKTRSLYYKALLARACSEWGFNPERPSQPIQPESVELNDWEKEFVEDIHDIIVFGIDVREEKRKQENEKCKKEMLNFVREGGKWQDIPEHIRCESLKKMYNECKDIYHQEMLDLADYAINLGANS